MRIQYHSKNNSSLRLRPRRFGQLALCICYVALRMLRLGRLRRKHAVCDRMALVLVELKKFRQRYANLDKSVMDDNLLRWLYLLTAGYRNRKEVTQLMEAFPTMEQFARQCGCALDDPQLMTLYDLYEESEIELASREAYFKRLRREGAEEGCEEGFGEGETKGLEEGRAKGLQEGRAKGLEEGRAKGLEEGCAKGRTEGDAARIVKSVKSMMAKSELTLEESFNLLGLTEGERFLAREGFNQKG